MRGRWRGGHAATDEVDVGCALHDRRCGRRRSPSPAAACVIPCFQFSMLLHNLSSIFSLGKEASQRALRCTHVPHRTAATTRQPKASHPHRPKARARLCPAKSARQTAPGRKPTPHPHIPPCRHCPMLRRARPPQRASQKRPPHPHRPKARARLGPAKSPCRTRTSPLSALPHAPPRPAAARTGVCPTASTPSRATPVHCCAPTGPRPAESTHQAARARPQRPERLATSFPQSFPHFRRFPTAAFFPPGFL